MVTNRRLPLTSSSLLMFRCDPLKTSLSIKVMGLTPLLKRLHMCSFEKFNMWNWCLSNYVSNMDVFMDVFCTKFFLWLEFKWLIFYCPSYFRMIKDHRKSSLDSQGTHRLENSDPWTLRIGRWVLRIETLILSKKMHPLKIV